MSIIQSFFSSLVLFKFFIITKCATNDISPYDIKIFLTCIFVPYLKKNFNLILKSISPKNIIFRIFIFPSKLLIV